MRGEPLNNGADKMELGRLLVGSYSIHLASHSRYTVHLVTGQFQNNPPWFARINSLRKKLLSDSIIRRYSH